MAKKFHDDEFDDATQIKLAIFRGYIRKWLPVFLTARKSGITIGQSTCLTFSLVRVLMRRAIPAPPVSSKMS